MIYAGGQHAAAQTPARQAHIYVASISWHTGIIIPADWLSDIWPDSLEYQHADYLEIGWGDADFYQQSEFDLWTGARAALWPTESILHVLPLGTPVDSNYPEGNLVKLPLGKERRDQLRHFLKSQFALNEQGKARWIAPGIYPSSDFFAGRESYYFPYNSNVWVARALSEAGFDLIPLRYQTTEALLDRLAELGERL